MLGIVGLIVAVVMAEWVYLVVNSHGGQRPWLWAIGAFVFWPLVATIAAFKYNETALKMVALMGLFIIVMGIGLVAYL